MNHFGAFTGEKVMGFASNGTNVLGPHSLTAGTPGPQTCHMPPSLNTLWPTLMRRWPLFARYKVKYGLKLSFIIYELFHF